MTNLPGCGTVQPVAAMTLHKTKDPPDMLKLSTFRHPSLGYFTLPRKTVARFNSAQLYAAAELILQVGH